MYDIIYSCIFGKLSKLKRNEHHVIEENAKNFIKKEP